MNLRAWIVLKPREAIVKRLEEENLLEKIEPHSLAVGHCERCKTVIEPYLSDQWFVNETISRKSYKSL